VVSLSPLLSDDLQTLAANITEAGRLADFIASSLTTIATAVKQEVLETLDVRARMDALNRILIKELEVLELGSKIQSQVQSEVGKNQREYFLREQMKAIQKELGEGDDPDQGRRRAAAEGLDAAGMPEEREEGSAARADRMSKMPVAAARVYGLAHLSGLARHASVAKTDRRGHRSRQGQGRARRGSPGLEKAKDRISEYLAVRKLNPDVKGPILCFVGPPRRGQDLARALHRAVARSEVRSRLARRHARRGRDSRPSPHLHRRAAGQIMQGMRRAESKNPVFILDEIDKLGSDFRGDPASALLEVLDPSRTAPFRDHYLDVPFDSVRGAVHHHGECARPGSAGPARPHGSARDSRYTEEEKLAIAASTWSRSRSRITA
jgi:ATP-dependent Lon protease